uniref:Uncharacterized protein n=1 Tax=viral metagenome TaxID=1070528 RepID=A0A6C0EQC2_9ZZZZ
MSELISNVSESINFDMLKLPIPDIILSLSNEIQLEIFNYLNQLDQYQRTAYFIAYSHLGTSFNIFKSNGYKEWKNKNN